MTRISINLRQVVYVTNDALPGKFEYQLEGGQCISLKSFGCFFPLSEDWKFQTDTLPNDLTHPNTFIAVYRGANRSKDKKDPALWMPPNKAYRCEYAIIWTAIKEHWGLSFDDAEREALRGIE